MANFKLEAKDVRLTDGKFITNLDVCSNNVIATSNVEATYFVGSAKYLTDLPELGDVSNVYISTYFLSNSYFNSLDLAGNVSNTYLQEVIGGDLYLPYIATEVYTNTTNTVFDTPDGSPNTQTYNEVYINGLRITNTSFTANGTHVELTTPPSLSDTIEIVTYEGFGRGDTVSNTYFHNSLVVDYALQLKDTYTNTTNTTFAVDTSNNFVFDVYLNGLRLPNTLYTVANNELSLTGVTPTSNDIIEIVELRGQAFLNDVFTTNTYVNGVQTALNATLDTKAANVYVNDNINTLNNTIDTKAVNTYVNDNFTSNVYAQATFDPIGEAVAMAIALG